MKKTSKVLSFIIGSAMVVGATSSLSADAAWGPVGVNSFTPPEGSVVDTLDTEKGEVVYRIVDGSYPSEWHSKSGCYYQICNGFSYNELTIILSDDFNTVYLDKVTDLVGSIGTDVSGVDYTYTGEIANLYARDKYEKGTDPTKKEVTDRYDKVKAVIDELYKEGFIKSAKFSPVHYFETNQYLMDHIYIRDSSAPIEEYQNLAKTYSEKAVVKDGTDFWNDTDDRLISIRLNLDLDDYTYDNLQAIRDEFKGLCEGSRASISLRREENIPEAVGQQTINLLDPYICDIDASGKADPSDATAILSAYAENAAGLRTAVDEKMDVNGDGEVSVDDATYVLSYYAQAAAGLR